jgi:MFS family permease
MGLIRGAGGFLTFLLAFSLKRSHQPSWFDGIVVACAAVGALVGTLTAPRLRRHVREETMVLSGLGAVALAALAAGLAHGRWPLVVPALVMGVATGGGRLAFDSVVQRDAPELARGRLFARYETRFQLAWVVGAFIPVAAPIGLRPGLAALGIVLVVLTGSAAAALRRVAPLETEEIKTERA